MGPGGNQSAIGRPPRVLQGPNFPNLLRHFSQQGGALPHPEGQLVSSEQALLIWVRSVPGGHTTGLFLD